MRKYLDWAAIKRGWEASQARAQSPVQPGFKASVRRVLISLFWAGIIATIYVLLLIWATGSY